MSPTEFQDRVGEDDWDGLGSICGALDARQLEWLHANDFVTPWLDQRARPVIELAPLVATMADRPFDRDVRSALGVLSDAIESFGAFYSDGTSPDPLLLGEDWRFFDQVDLNVYGDGSAVSGLRGERAAQLHQLAADVAAAYERFVSVAAQLPVVGRRINLPV